ncbi:hypothetical protein CGC20_21290 [Leishmania donovani]|uniref:Flagellar attachment zone protein 1 conserved domain-containing protein n=1 Tax=Leishmania donovani TaxID=5661 RepID=A0A504XGS3_LEIDO|nr:hypothetical protein CGC20_21290 [Leishmania donovani]
MTAKLESEAASSKAEAKTHQDRLLAIRERIESQSCGTSKEEKERTSEELSECLVLIGKHRNRSRSLLADLEIIKGPSTVQVKCQQFTPASSSIAILRSSILRVISHVTTPSLVLSSEEVESIEKAVTHTHSQLNSELHKLRATVEATEIESNELRDQIRNLEEQLKRVKTTFEPVRISDGGESGSAFPEKLREHDILSLRGAWDSSTALVMTEHTIKFPWDDGDTLLHHKPEETKSVFAAEAAFACCVPIQCVTNPKMTTHGKHLSAEFSVSHPETVTTKEIDQRLASYAFPSMHLLHEEPLGVKTGLDRAIEGLEHALGIPEGKHEGLYFDEFMENMPDTTFSNDKDAYESEIGDLLMLLDKLNNENRSLQYTLDKSAAELKRQVSEAQKDHDALNTEIGRLRNIVSKLKDLAEQQETELVRSRVQTQRAEEARFHYNLAPPANDSQDAEYAVTMQEYKDQKEATENAQRALVEEKAKAEQMHHLLKMHEQQSAQNAKRLRSLQDAFAAETQQTAENFCALECELIDVLLQFKASQALTQALHHINSQQQAELFSFRARRNAALEARDADGTLPVPARPVPAGEAAERALEPQQIADEPLYAVTLEEYLGKDAAVEQLAAELEEQRAEAERLAKEVAAFRARRNAALEARDADGTLPVPARPVPAGEAAERALEPQQIADEPLYAVTLEEYLGKDAAVEQLAAELEEQRAEAERLAKEVAAFRARRNAALEARDADGTLPVPARPVPAGEAAERALEPQQIADEPLYAVTLEEYLGKDAAVEQLAAELEEQRAEAERLAKEVAAFRARRNAALEARDADGTLPVPARPVPAGEAAERALEPQQIADEPLYAVTLEEYLGKDAAVEQLAAELEEQRAEAERLAKEVAAFRARRNAALEARDADGTLPVPARPVPAGEAAERALEPQQIADEPLYADAAVEQLAAELEEQRAGAERLAKEVAAFRARRNAALEARDADGTLPVPARPVPAGEAAERALEPQQIADEPLYAVTLEELEQAREDAARGVAAIEDNAAALESELLDVLAELKAVKGENAALRAVCEMKDAAVADLEKHDVRANNSDKAKPQTTSRHTKVFEGEEWGAVVETKPHALHDAFVTDVCAACRVCRDDLSEIAFALGSLQASVSVTHNSDISCDDIAKLVEEYHYPNVWALYAKRLAPKDGLDEAKDAISDLQLALVAKEEDAARIAEKLHEERAEAERLAKEVAAFRARRNAALEARDADGTLPVPARPVPAGEAAERALEPQQIADEPLYAVTLEEYLGKDAAVEQLAAELEEQRAEAERLAKEVAAFRARRNAALEARDADGTLPVPARPAPAGEAAERALEPQQIADEPLYAVTLEEYLGKDAAVEQLAAELEEQRAGAERLAKEVAAFRARRNAALEARDADGTLPVPARPVPAGEAAERALEPQQIADEPLYAVTLGEYLGKDAAVEQLAAELEEQRAEAERLAKEVAAFRARRNAALEARDADGTLPVPARPVPAGEAAERALEPQQIADEPLYAVTLEELEQAREDAARGVAAIEDNAAALESELLDVLAELKAVKGENAALRAVCEMKDAAVADLEKHDVRANNSDKAKPQTTSRHTKVFEGEEWGAVVETKPHALHDAFVTDVCAACRVCRDDLSEIAFALGSLQASVSVTHNSDISCDDIAKLVEEYHYPNVWALYAKRLAPKDGLDEAKDAISDLQLALAAKEEDAARVAEKLHEERAEAERLAKEVAAFRARRNAALEARDADGTLPVPARPVPAGEAAERALEPQQIADEPLYADAAVEQLAAELEEQRAEAERLAKEVAAFRARRNAALEARDADGTLPVPARPVPAGEAAERALEPQQIADEPLYADAAVEQLAAELEEQRAEAERLAKEVAAFRARRNAALEARDADGTLPVPARPVPAGEAAERALEPQQIADEPLYAVTLEEYLGKDAAVEQLAAELEEQRAEAERLAKEVAAFRARRNAALEARDADGTLPVPARPVPAGEAAERALEPQQIADEPLYAVTLEEYLGKDAAVEQLAAELEEQRAEAERLAKEVAAFRARRNAALEARDADGTLPVPARPVPAGEAAERALEPQQIADEPLYAVTLEEYLGKDAAVEQLAAELEEQRAEAERLAKEVAAFRARRNAALEARDADGTLPVPARPVPAGEAAERALEPQQIADEPLYADAAVEQLAAELEEQRAEAERLAKEVAAFRARRNAALEARDADGTLPVPARPVPAGEAAERALEPQQIADEPLYAVTLEELEQAREDAARGVAAIEDNAAALESELLDVLAELKAVKGENAALRAVCEMKDAAVADLEKHDVRANNSDKAKPQTTSRHTKVFEGEEWGAVVETKPHALHDAFVTDVCAACRVCRDDLSEIAFALGSLQASVSVTHNSDISCDDIAKLVEEYHYPNVWALYAKRLAPKDGLDEAKDAISDLQLALAAKEEDAARVAEKLHEERAEAERLAKEVAAFRARRNAALEARDADGTLPVPARPVPAGEAAERALEPQQIADEPLYAVTLGEYLGKDAAVEQLAAELEEQRAEAERLAKEVAAFRARRNAALEARDADGTLPVPARPVPAGEAAERALEPQQIADEPLYAVTLGEYLGKDAAVEQLAAELEEQRAEAERLAKEVAAFRARRNAALEARDADGTLPVPARPVPAGEAAERALEPQQIADEPLYAVTLEEYLGKDAAVEQLAAELEEQRAEAERLAKEVAAFRARRNAALEARDADGTLPVPARPVPAGEAAERALEPQQIADEPLYAVTLEEYLGKDAAVEQLAAELEEQRAEAERLAKEVAAFRARRNAALEARDADGTLPVPARPVPAGEAAERALEPQQIADEPLYAVTLEEYLGKDAAVEQLAAELEEQRAEAERLAKEVAAFRARRNAALEARDADGTLPVPARPAPAGEAAERALEPQQIADEPLYAVTLEEYLGKDAAVEQLAAELEEQRAEAERLAKEVAAFRARRNAALEARDADGTLPVPARPVPAGEAAERALEPQQIADEPLYAVTLEEFCAVRAEAESRGFDVEDLGRQLSEKGDECGDLLEKLEEAVGLLAEARNESEDVRGQWAEAERASEAALRTMEKDRAKVAAELSALSLTNEKLVAEVRAFRRRRLDTIACREAEGRFSGEELSEKVDVAGVDVPVSPVTIEREPLFCVKLDELKEQRDLNAQMVMELSALGERIRDAMDPDAVRDPSSEAVFSHLEALLKALEESRDAEQSWRDLAEERERELEQLRKLFKNEEERWKNDLGEAQEEVERLQGELDLLTDKLDEACRLFGDADAVSAEGVAKLEAFAEVLAAARDTEKAAMVQLEAKESELEELRIALKDTKVCEEMRENLEDELKQLQKEKEITETELGAVQKEVNDLRYDLRAAEYRAAEKAREVERMTLDLDALNNRIQDLLEELKEKTDQYNQVIKDLDDFANSQSHENEKELLQRLAAREQELFELQEARRGENDEHEKQVGVLRDQINRLRDQTDQDNTLHDGLQDELARLRKLLLDAEAALRDKTAENEALKDDMESMIDEHEAQMREMEQELEGKGKEVSDALERLEEMSAMVQEAREGEESALRLRADSDAEVFRLQKELDKIKRLQSAMAESGDDKSSLFAQIIDTEGQLRDAVATIRKKDAQLDEVEKEWQKKLNKSEDLNHDLRRLLKRTMAALSKSKDTMGNSAGALDAFRDELKPMMQ